MTETLEIVVDAATKLFASAFGPNELRAAAHGIWPAEGWAALEDMGLPLALVGEEAGGFGVPIDEALALVRLAAQHAVSAALPETMFAHHLASRAGLQIATGPAAVASSSPKDPVRLLRKSRGWRLTGVTQAAPWPDALSALIVVANDGEHTRLARIDRSQFNVVEGSRTLAGHPCGQLQIDAELQDSETAALPDGAPPDVALLGGAALRTMGIAGAAQRVLDLTVSYVSERVQFGRTLSKFQTVQHEIARMAGQVAAARAAADMAAEAFAGGFDVERIAAAKARAGEAAGVVAALAHQLHGAIGVTEEYRLHYLTRQLWTWRDEYGGEAFWNERLGRLAIGKGRDRLWTWLTAI